MNTTKVNKTQKIETQPSIDKSKFVETNNKNKIKRNRTVLKVVLCILGLVVVLLSAARVPYAGSYIDGLFDYIFGQTKYVFYVWSLFTLIALLYNGRIARIIKTKRYFIFSALALLSIGCIVSGCYDLSKYFKQNPTFAERMNEYNSNWLAYFKTTDYSKYFNSCISGGILAVLLSFLFNFISYAILIVFAVIILIISILIIFNINYKSTRIGLKLRGWLVRKLGGSFKYDGYDELKQNSDNQNRISKHKKSDIESSAQKEDAINFDLLPESDINSDQQNWKRAASIQTKLANLFKKEGVDCIPSDINVYTSYSEICFETKASSDIKEIVKLQDQISKISKLDKFNISYRGNILSIDYDNLHFSKLSLKSVSKLVKRAELMSFFGINKNKKLVTQEFNLSPSALIVGKKGSGSATLTVLMMLSMCYTTSPEKLDLVILNPNAEQTYTSFTNMPHTSGKTYESINAVTNKLHDLQNIVNQRASLLKVNNVDNIEQYNKITNDSTTIMKNILVVIPNFENAIKETFQNAKIIEELLVNGPNVGLYTILQSYSVNNEVMDPGIYSNVSDKYILTLETQGESAKIFNNYRGYQLHSNGDCLHFEKEKVKSMERIQVCNINKSELATDIDIAKTFYTIKKEQAQEIVLEDHNNEKQII